MIRLRNRLRRQRRRIPTLHQLRCGWSTGHRNTLTRQLPTGRTGRCCILCGRWEQP